MNQRRTTSAFTLVELSVVLVIIGLLVGGVTVGQDMIRRTRLTKIVTDLNKYKTAYFKFQQIYQALPGDYLDATEQWGTDTGTACSVSPIAGDRVPKKETCNGDGNTHVADTDGTVASDEMFRAWQQMADAGLIQGAFSGVAGTGSSYDSTVGVNAPAGPIDGSGYLIFWRDARAVDSAVLYASNYGNIIQFGIDMPAHYTYGPTLTPTEARNMDAKIDDGRPGLGNFVTSPSTINPGCTTTDVAATAYYNLTTTSIACSAMYILP